MNTIHSLLDSWHRLNLLLREWGLPMADLILNPIVASDVSLEGKQILSLINVQSKDTTRSKHYLVKRKEKKRYL